MLALARSTIMLASAAACAIAGPSNAEQAITNARACTAAGGEVRRFVVRNGATLDALLVNAPGPRRVTVSRLTPSTDGVDPRRLRVITPEIVRAAEAELGAAAEADRLRRRIEAIAPELIPGREIHVTTWSVRLSIRRNREGGSASCASMLDGGGSLYCAGDQNRPVEVCVRVRAEPRGPRLLARRT